MSDSDSYERQDQADDYDRNRAVETNPAERGKWISALVALLGL